MNSETTIHGRHFDHSAEPRGFQNEKQIPRRAVAPRNDMKRHPELLKALHAEWRKLSPNLTAPNEEMTERELRIWYANEKLGRKADSSPSARNDGARAPIASWNDLAPNEARHLLTCMREESGDGPAYRAQLIARLAQELFGAPWDRMLGDRLRARFQKSKAADLTPREAHSEIEELLSRVARSKGEDIEAVRARV